MRKITRHRRLLFLLDGLCIAAIAAGYFVIDFPLAFRTHFAKIFEDLIVPSRCEVSGMHAAGDIPMPLVGMLLPLLRKSPVTRFPLKIARVPKQDIRLL